MTRPHEPAPRPSVAERLRTALRRVSARDLGPAAMPRLILTVIPAMLIAGIAASTVWGHNGILARRQLERDVDRAGDHLATVERDNQRLLRDLTLMDSDPVVLERTVAEELMMARDGATIYQFDPPKDAPRPK